jgi:hypothetical protein
MVTIYCDFCNTICDTYDKGKQSTHTILLAEFSKSGTCLVDKHIDICKECYKKLLEKVHKSQSDKEGIS